MWSAKIESKTFEKGTLQIGVIYSNSTVTFSEPYTINTEADIDNQISAKLKQLESLEKIQVSIGSYEPKITPAELPAE